MRQILRVVAVSCAIAGSSCWGTELNAAPRPQPETSAGRFRGELPRAKYSVPTETDRFTIDVLVDGSVWLAGAKCSYDVMVGELRRAARRVPGRRARIDGAEVTLSNLEVLVRTDRRAPALAFAKIMEACAQRDVGVFKLFVALDAHEEVPFYLPVGRDPAEARHVECLLTHEEQATDEGSLLRRLAELAADPAQRVRSPETGNMVPPALVVHTESSVAFGDVVRVMDLALEAGFGDLVLRAGANGALDRSWTAGDTRHRLTVLVDAIGAPAGRSGHRVIVSREIPLRTERNNLRGGTTRPWFAGRARGRDRLLKGNGRDTANAIQLGLNWLREHQDDDGKWDADEFAVHDREGEPCNGKGKAVHDVGVTALALLAFLGDGSSLRAGPYRDSVKKAARWLRDQQDESGLFGTNAAHDYIYDHAIATLAMVETYGYSQYKQLRKYAQKGIDYLEKHRTPGGVWRYQPHSADSDMSVTVWAAMACAIGQDCGLRVDPKTLEECAQWLETMTYPTTGRCGYRERGGPVERREGEHHERFPPEKSEAMTAAALLCRYFLGQDHKQFPVMDRAADTILRVRPAWDQPGGAVDQYYWYYATTALYQRGGRGWAKWAKSLTNAVVETQRADGNYTGSWDPVGPWGEDGGRVYSTAMLVLTLESYYRYSRLLR